MPTEIIDGAFRPHIQPWLDARRSRVWLATPFMSFRIAHWLSTTSAAGSGDRRALVAWDPRSLDERYLSAAGVEALRLAGFEVRSLQRLHAKLVIVGARAYMGSGNLTGYGLDAGNVELGALLSGKATATVADAYERWWGASEALDPKTIQRAIKQQGGAGIAQETQPGHRPPPPPLPSPPVLPPDAEPAPAADPPAVVHYWRSETIADNFGNAGSRQRAFFSRAAMAGKLTPGTRVYTVGWAPIGGLLLMNRFTVRSVRRRGNEWQVSGNDATPLAFDRVVAGQEYARTVRIRNQRQAPIHHMAFSPMAYLSQRTARAFDRLVDD